MDSVVTVKQIQNLDKEAIDNIGVPSIALMENAGREVALEIMKCLKKKESPCVCVVCGIGNNAGDGFVVARHLINSGVKTKVFLIGDSNSLKKDALINYNILKRCKYKINELDSLSDNNGIKKLLNVIKRNVNTCDLIVDAIFGVGLNREIQDPYKSVIDELNKHKKRIVSVDIPSGLDGTSGNIYGTCIKAYKTVTFSFAKKGLFVNNGHQVSGKVVVVDIGIPEKCCRTLHK